MSRLIVFMTVFLILQVCFAQIGDKIGSEYDHYLAEQKKIEKSVSRFIYSDFPAFNSMNEVRFTKEVDSLRKVFTRLLERYSNELERTIINDERIGIKYFFDRLLLDYPYYHRIYTGKRVSLSEKNQSRLDSNFTDFNKPELLSNKEFKEYVKAFLHHQINEELKNNMYAGVDNQRLHAVWKLINARFNQKVVKDFWRYEYLSNHIDNIGIKNIEDFYDDFMNSCKNPDYLAQVRELYETDKEGRQGHLIETYKTVEGFDLDMHLFLPDTSFLSGKRPAIVFFHGGSWTEGKPDWFFGTCDYYANKGWVATAVEYRIGSRHGTLPFAAVKDAKSAIRWLRENARRLKIDTSKIIASGNSSGGHLVLAAALADKWNEKTDNLRISAIPNVLIVTSGAYDLTIPNTRWIVDDLEDKDLVNEISPNHLMKENLPPTLIIHGRYDHNCPYHTAEYFVQKMRALGNNIEFHTIEGAGHFIWFGEHAGEVSKIRDNYLESLGIDQKNNAPNN